MSSLESTSVGLTVHERTGPNELWQVTTLLAEDILRMPELAIEVPVGDFYVDITFSDGTVPQI